MLSCGFSAKEIISSETPVSLVALRVVHAFLQHTRALSGFGKELLIRNQLYIVYPMII